MRPGCLALMLALLPGVACAQWFMPWTQVPSITVVAEGSDPRIPLVEEARAYWNQALADLGSGFRLGPVAVLDRPVPERDLQQFGAGFVGPPPAAGPPAPPASLLAVPGDLIVYLGQSDFVSFASWLTADRRRIVGIRGHTFPPMDAPNVTRNVIAHEIGHAIGLGHAADPRLLMCGRPAPCRPVDFRSSETRIFPLSDEEGRRLLLMYPVHWPSR